MATNAILARLLVKIQGDHAEFSKSTAKAQRDLANFSKTGTNAINTLKGAVATLGLVAIGKEIIDTTAQFQRFSAVLENTLGSQSAAAIAIRDIENFASKTPFAVDELTGSFVKLANQGFTPTVEELRKLGDLASSTGKGFDQLTEAIIDAQTGEFERLKEFGIRAKKQGDQVTFTFKGVETQTKFTSQAIREYILSLGDAEGVSGSMAKISETLGGQMSNLGDTWTTFLKTIGDGNDGILAGAVSILGEIVKAATKLIRTNEQLQNEIKVDAQSTILTELKDLISITGDVEASTAKLTAGIQEQKEAIEDEIKAFEPRKNIFGVIIEQDEDHLFMLNAKKVALDGQITAIGDYTAGLTKQATAQEEVNKKTTVSLGLIPQIEKDLKFFEEQKKKSFSTTEIENFNVKIQELQDTLSVLNASRPLSSFAKKQLQNAERGLPTDTDLTSSTIGGGFLTQLPPIPPPDMTAFQAAFAQVQEEYKKTGDVAKFHANASAEAWQTQIDKQMAAADAAEQYGSVIGNALGQALSGQQSFAQAMKSITAQLLTMFLQRALGGIIASAATSGGPPPVAIALAAAGVAAISAMFAKIGGPTRSVGGGGLSASQSVQRMSPIESGQQVQFDAQFRVEGDALVAVANNYNHNSSRGG